MQIIFLVAATILGQALAIPPGLCADGPSVRLCGDYKKRAVCNHDNLLRSFLDSRYSVSATSFCSSYIQQTTTIDTTTTTILTASALQKRASTTNTDFAGITSYGSSRLSSACTCLISPPPTATQSAAATVTVTVQPGTGTCGLGPGFTDGSSGQDNFIGYLGTASSLSGCEALCAAYDGCKAYALGDTYCYGYSDVLANDKFYSDSTSPYYFFDLTCQY